MLPWLSSPHPTFPSTEQALENPNGLLAAGGELTPAWLVDAYRKGIFPWYSDDDPILWWSPDPRCILVPQEFHFSRSMRRLLSQDRFRFTVDTCFVDVVSACADTPRSGQNGTWITGDMISGYSELHRLGYAHSFETWAGDELIGGLYGVSVGSFFFGESMYSLEPNASKAALSKLVTFALGRGFDLIDCQNHSDHLISLGARMISRSSYLTMLQGAIRGKTLKGPWKL